MAVLVFLALVYKVHLRNNVGVVESSLSLSSARTACTLKGGYLSIATHGLLLALQPSPLALTHGIATCHTSGG